MRRALVANQFGGGSVRREPEETLDEDTVLPFAVELAVAALDADLFEPGGGVRGPAGLVVGEHSGGEFVEPAAFRLSIATINGWPSSTQLLMSSIVRGVVSNVAMRSAIPTL